VPRLDEPAVGQIFREESGRSIAVLVRAFGDIDLAEDAVQEAFAVALRTWARDGLPPSPGGWITTTARNRAIDRLRREARGQELLSAVAVLTPERDEPGLPDETRPVQDDRLRLIFTCCHPALSIEAQIALTLRLLGGLSTKEVARSFLVTEPTMATRLARAKRKIKAARIPYRIPEEHELPDRLRPVLAVVYLIYTAAQTSQAEPGLCAEAIRLARILATLMPDEPEVAGLVALLLLTESRRASRIRPDGTLALLGEQDRKRWDRALIDEGQSIVRRCLRRNQPGPYQLQAAINAVHADAATLETGRRSSLCTTSCLRSPPRRSLPSTERSRSARFRAPRQRSLWSTNWTWTTTNPSTPPEPICCSGSAKPARPRPLTSAQPLWRQPTPSGTSSGSVAERRAERTADFEQVADAGLYLVAETLDRAALKCPPISFDGRPS